MKGALSLSAANFIDLWRIRAWRNSPDVVIHTVSKTYVTRLEHLLWSARCVWGRDQFAFVGGRLGQSRCGVVIIKRVNGSPERWAVSVIVNPDERGQGYGRRLVQSLALWFQDRFPTESLTAVIHVENVASQRTFAGAGFAFHQTIDGEFIELICGPALAENCDS